MMWRQSQNGVAEMCCREWEYLMQRPYGGNMIGVSEKKKEGQPCCSG